MRKTNKEKLANYKAKPGCRACATFCNKHCVERSVFGAILVRIFSHSVWMLENVDQYNAEYEHFLRSETCDTFVASP